MSSPPRCARSVPVPRRGGRVVPGRQVPARVRCGLRCGTAMRRLPGSGRPDRLGPLSGAFGVRCVTCERHRAWSMPATLIAERDENQPNPDGDHRTFSNEWLNPDIGAWCGLWVVVTAVDHTIWFSWRGLGTDHEGSKVHQKGGFEGVSGTLDRFRTSRRFASCAVDHRSAPGCPGGLVDHPNGAVQASIRAPHRTTRLPDPRGSPAHGECALYGIHGLTRLR